MHSGASVTVTLNFLPGCWIFQVLVADTLLAPPPYETAGEIIQKIREFLRIRLSNNPSKDLVTDFYQELPFANAN